MELFQELTEVELEILSGCNSNCYFQAKKVKHCQDLDVIIDKELVSSFIYYLKDEIYFSKTCPNLRQKLINNLVKSKISLIEDKWICSKATSFKDYIKAWKEENYQQALLIACHSNKIKAMDIILQRCDNLDLFYALAIACKNQNKEIINLLLKYGASYCPYCLEDHSKSKIMKFLRKVI